MNHGEMFILGIIAISTCGGIVRMWVGGKHGADYDERQQRLHERHKLFKARMRQGWAGMGAMPGWSDPDADRKVELLSAENERLTGQISRLEERIAVLERIATDPAERVAREIDSLR
jgi:hypothetical protein